MTLIRRHTLIIVQTYLRGYSRCLRVCNSRTSISSRCLTNLFPSAGLLVIFMVVDEKTENKNFINFHILSVSFHWLQPIPDDRDFTT